MIDPRVKYTLDMRLARGELDEPTYYRLMAALDHDRETVDATAEAAPHQRNNILYCFEEISIYESNIAIGKNIYSYDQILDVQCHSYKATMNLIPIINSTSLSISFIDGSYFEKKENRIIFGRNRHKSIRRAGYIVKEKTFEPLLKKFVDSLALSPLRIGTESAEPFPSIASSIKRLVNDRQLRSITLDASGVLSNGILNIDLKQSRAEGHLEIGIMRQNYTNPTGVYASTNKTLIEQNHKNALKFDIDGSYRPDVVMHVLNWLSIAGNTLE